jgi:prolyl-tRNA synthetase
MYDAYCRIFDRLGLNYKIVKADTGAMGGLLSEEYQAISQIGEDIVVGCSGCDFSSNLEIAQVVDLKEDEEGEALPIEKVFTPNAKTIEEVAAFFGKKPENFVKTLIYNADGKIVAFCVPGDRELNETKAGKLLNATQLELASFDDVEAATHAKVGFAGPVGLEIPVYLDRQVLHMKNFIVGANETDHHYTNVNLSDFSYVVAADLTQVCEGDICPVCGKPLIFEHGIEVGNLFKLGTKYSKTMNLMYTDQNNQLQPVWMGSYGIGLERCMAAVAEQHHDDKGIIWPDEVAPFKVCIVPVSLKDEKQVELANELYDYCKSKNISVLLDDRNERPGVKFKDMELIGIPYRVTVGKGIANGVVEFTKRADGIKEEVSLDEIKNRLDRLTK